MVVEKIILRNYRNYDYLSLEFNPKLNIIVGANGAGKTNIVESIQYLSLARSFRTQESTDLIKKGCQFATIEARVVENTSKKDIVAILTANTKKISCNNNQIKKISDLSKLVNVIVFEPKDALMFKQSPLVRRNFLDINLSKKSPLYLDALITYERLLKERNKLLKDDEPNKIQIDVVTSQLVKVSKTIDEHRVKYINDLNQILTKVTSQLSGENDNVRIIYEPFIELNDDYEEQCTRAYERAYESDVKHKVTSVGVHREDYSMILNNKDISSYGSQGENRLAVIALKLSPYFLIEEREKRPIIVLDDVMSELDDTHKERLISFLRKFEQVFITSTSINVKNASIYEVNKNQKVTRRNS